MNSYLIMLWLARITQGLAVGLSLGLLITWTIMAFLALPVGFYQPQTPF